MERETLIVVLTLLCVALATALGFALAALRQGRRHGQSADSTPTEPVPDAATMAYLQRLVDELPQPVYVKDGNARFVLVNAAFARERGMPAAELLRLSSYDLSPDAATTRLIAEEDASVLAGTPISKELLTRSALTGEERYRVVSKRRSTDALGQPVIVCTHFDITDWKMAQSDMQTTLAREVELRRRAQTYVQRLIDVIPQPVYVKDAESRYLMVNEAFARERGQPISEIVGKSSFDLAKNREVATQTANEDAEVLAGRVVSKEENNRHLVTGKERYRIISKGSCLDAEGRAVIVGANFDITNWRVAERELQETVAQQSRLREFFQSIIEVLPNPLFVKDDQHRYIMANHAFAGLFGKSVSDVIGRRASELMSPDLAFGLEAKQHELISRADGRIFESELGLPGKTGLRHFVLRQVVTDGMDHQRVLVGVLTDISSLREAEARWLQAKHTAEQANAAKSLFLASMSHEIRTPLSGVIGTLRIALRERHLPSTTREHINSSLGNAESLLAIINDILDFSKIEAGQLTVEQIDFDLHNTARNSLEPLRGPADSKNLLFALTIDPDVPRYMRGDPTRIRQVLINLVGNAIKFTEKGKVSVRISCDKGLGNWELSDWRRIRLRVEDSGIGIPRESLPHLFQEFQQADTSTTRRYGGTGLGLAICRQLVEAMGGQIRVESEQGVGSTFEFELPMQTGLPPPEADDTPLPPHKYQLHILCAEDFPTNQLIVRTLLEDMGQQITIVENGRLAVEALSQQDYDLVLMDGRMPELDGVGATCAIRSGGLPGFPVRDPLITVVALTANVSAEDRQQYLDSGMNGFLTKPIDQRALHMTVAEAIKRRLREGAKLPPALVYDEDAEADSGQSADLRTASPGLLASAAPRTKRSPEELAQRLRTLFVGSLPQRLAEIDAAWAQRDIESFGRICHGIRGSAGFVQEEDIQTRATALEAAALAGEIDAIEQTLPAFRAALTEAGQRLA